MLRLKVILKPQPQIQKIQIRQMKTKQEEVVDLKQDKRDVVQHCLLTVQTVRLHRLLTVQTVRPHPRRVRQMSQPLKHNLQLPKNYEQILIGCIISIYSGVKAPPGILGAAFNDRDCSLR